MQDAEKDNTEWSVGWGIMSPLPSTTTTTAIDTTVTASSVTIASTSTATSAIGTSNTIRNSGTTPTTTRARSITATTTTDTHTSPSTGAGPSPSLSSVPQASDIAASKLGLYQQQLPQTQQTMALTQEPPAVDLVLGRTLSTPHPTHAMTADWTSTQSGDAKMGDMGDKGLGGGKVGTSPARVTGQDGGLRPSALLSAAASSTFITPTFSQVSEPPRFNSYTSTLARSFVHSHSTTPLLLRPYSC